MKERELQTNTSEHLKYFPYGETSVHNKATSDASTTLSNRSTPYKFTSKELDEETGLYYFGIRTYDPKLSRWISAAPPLVNGKYFSVPPVNEESKTITVNSLEWVGYSIQ